MDRRGQSPRPGDTIRPPESEGERVVYTRDGDVLVDGERYVPWGEGKAAELERLRERADEMDRTCRELAWWTLPTAPPDDLTEAARNAIRHYRMARDDHS
jgi:hypothetical protein